MAKKWYVVHTYSGYENRVKASLEERIKTAGMQEFFSEVIIPSEKIVEMVKGEKRITSRKFFPGYILVKMELNDDTWHLVKNTPKVTGFVGGGTTPTFISEDDVKKITHQMEEGAARPKPRVSFERGEGIRVVDGPFTNFTGVVEEVKPDKGKLKVLVSIFGRATPVEVDFIQVEKV
ncbi:MAG: transcription termination/antitermination protein NusG [Deltaproteobacteria bacterium]|nr:transcription termination/antitermination protein NusG [Deltaproteobacteria bacterium]